MSLLGFQNLLEACPKHWTRSDYDEKSYVTVELNKHCAEYQNIHKDFVVHLNSLRIFLQPKVVNILRVQNPLAYGRFLLRQEQLQKRNGSVPATCKTYIQTNLKYLHDALEYNIDKRRTQYREMSTYSCLDFPFGAGDATNVFDATDTANCVLVVNGLSDISNIERNSEIYPEYIIHFSKEYTNHFMTEYYTCF